MISVLSISALCSVQGHTFSYWSIDIIDLPLGVTPRKPSASSWKISELEFPHVLRTWWHTLDVHVSTQAAETKGAACEYSTPTLTRMGLPHTCRHARIVARCVQATTTVTHKLEAMDLACYAIMMETDYTWMKRDVALHVFDYSARNKSKIK